MTFSYLRCEQFIDSMKALVVRFAETDDDVPEGIVLEELHNCGVTRDDFIELDERPGQFDHKYRENQWHRLLRLARNNPDNDLFEWLV